MTRTIAISMSVKPCCAWRMLMILPKLKALCGAMCYMFREEFYGPFHSANRDLSNELRTSYDDFLSALYVIQPLAQKAHFVGIGHLSAFEQSAEQYRGRFALAHVFEDEYAHLSGPVRGAARMPGDVLRVPERKRHVA